MAITSLLLADENFSQQSVEVLRELGYDVVTLVDLGLANQALPDDQVLQTAISLDRCILTFNRLDFIKLHRKNAKHSGIVVCTYNPDKRYLAEKIHAEISVRSTLHSQLIRIYRD